MSVSTRKRPYRWLPHAIRAGILTLLALLGSAAPEFLSDDFKAQFAPYNKWIVGLIILAVVVAVVEAICAVRASRRSDDDKSPPQQSGLSVGENNQGNFTFQGGNVTASNTQGDIVARDKIEIHQHLPVVQSIRNSLHQLPSPPINFVGRTPELRILRDNLSNHANQTGSATISSLHGMGGIGKTALMLTLATELKDRYPNAQLYLDLKGVGPQPMTPAEAMAQIIHAYHPEASLPDTFEALKPIYQSALHGQSGLLILDNARDAKQIAPLLPPPGWMTLVTSRFHFTVAGMQPLDLDALPLVDACSLLLRIAPRIEGEAERLAELCGRLPLALELVASALQVRRNLSPAAYATRLTVAGQRLREVDKYADARKAAFPSEDSLAAAFSSSYELLDASQQTGWRNLSFFPASFDEAAAAAVLALAEETAQELLGDLLSFSMLKFDDATRHYHWHDLARDYARNRASAAESQIIGQRHSAHFCKVLSEAHKLYRQGGETVLQGLSLYDQERINIVAGQTWAAAHREQDERAALLCVEYPNAGYSFLDLRMHPRDHLCWLKVQLAAAQRLGLRKMEGKALGNLGLVYSSLGEFRLAREFHEQALVVSREIGDRRGEGADLGNLGLAYRALGEPRLAIKFHEQALAIDREIGDRSGESADLGHLGLAYKDLGEPRKAIEFYEQALVIDREIGNRRGEGADLGNLGVAYENMGELHKAIEFYEQALVINHEIGNRRGEGIDLWKRSRILNKLGERALAIADAEAALRIYEEIENPHAEKVRRQLEEWRS